MSAALTDEPEIGQLRANRRGEVGGRTLALIGRKTIFFLVGETGPSIIILGAWTAVEAIDDVTPLTTFRFAA
tara:strand:+ start:2895 stop:3110 length:216 start_codon:yes stop_codon:yes gene_type:complete